MRFVKNAVVVTWLGAACGAAVAVESPLSTVTPESVRGWIQTRGAAAEGKEVVQVDLVFNFLKGVGCSDADAKAAADAAAERANELLKGACVQVNVKEINNDWEGPGNQGTGADGEVNESEVRRMKREGLKEVTGDDGMGGTKKGYKVFIVKDFVGDLDATVGCTIVCEPWTAIQKVVDGTSIGEILAHEIGHSFGKLEDVYDMDDMNCLMYGYVKEGSARLLKKGQGDKIRDGAADHGRTVKKPADEPAETPKQPKPKADGSFSRQTSAPLTNPAGEVAYGSIVTSSFNAGEGTDTIVDFTLVRGPAAPDPAFIHLGWDVDGDPTTGVALGPWEGIELRMLLIYDAGLGDSQWQLEDLIGGDFLAGPLMVGDGLLYTDEFQPFGAPPAPLLPLDEVVLGLEIPFPDLPIVVGPAPAIVTGFVSATPDPLQLPLPQDQFIELPVLPDDFAQRPILVAPGAAMPGDPIPIDGFGFPPLSPVDLCADGVPIATAMTDASGAFDLLVPLPPAIVPPLDLVILSGKGPTPGPSGFTWVELGPLPCPADFDGDGFVGASDLALLIGQWGQVGSAADLDGDGVIGAADLAMLIGDWGPCP